MRRMKDSGIEWIGEIPEEWAVRRLRYLTTLRLEKGYMGSENTYIGLENIESGTGRLIETETRYEEGIYDRFYAGDLMFSKLRPYLAKVVILNFDGFCTSELLVFKDTSVYKNFLYYVFLSDGFISTVDRSTYGTKMPRASWEFIKNIAIPVPLNTQQKIIADYLDRKCAEIDAAIARQEAVIEKLKEYKLSLITEAVTKGLNPDAPMKESGVEWIGKMPEHWEIHKFCWDHSALLGKMLDAKRVTGTQLHPYIKNVDVQWESINFDDLDEMDFSDDEKDRYTIRPGDLMICEGGEIGKCAIVPDSVPEDIYYQKALHRVRPRYSESGSLRFLSRVMFCMAKNNCLNTSPEKATIAHLPGDALSQLRIPAPPFAEQEMIADYLDHKCRTIDEAVEKKQSLIDRLTSYKKSLIYEVVTGKREVPA